MPKKNESLDGNNNVNQKILELRVPMDNQIDGNDQMNSIICNENLNENSGIINNDVEDIYRNENSKNKTYPFYFHNINNLEKESCKHKYIIKIKFSSS